MTIDGTEPGTAPVLDIRSPVTGQMIRQVSAANADDVVTAIDALRRAQPAWEALDPRERAMWLRRYRDWLLDNADRLSELLQGETGKPWAEASNLELPYIVEIINYYAKYARRFLAESTPRRHSMLTALKAQRMIRRAYPVVGIVTPWNFPLGLTFIDAVPALLAGAAVIIKPSEITPLATTAAVEGWREIGAPPVLACVNGAGAIGAAVVEGSDFVQFTGSTLTGKAVAHSAAERLIPCSLELGGKDPMIVLDDADIRRAANAAVWGAVANAGQMCTSVERIYVDTAVYDEFMTAVTARIADLRVGVPGGNHDYEVGPLISEAQVGIVEAHVADAVRKGARILAGGRAEGRFFEPTVVADVDHSMRCMTEETFGPLLPIMRVANAGEAVALANDSIYGLSAIVFGRDTARAEVVARRIDVGAVNINDVFGNLFAVPLPQSGWKQSGLGARNGGAHGLLKFTRTQGIVRARVAPSKEPNWYPYNGIRTRLVRRLSRLIGAKDMRRKLG